MQLVHWRFWTLAWLLQPGRIGTRLLGPVSGLRGGGARSELIDFVGQIKASHLGACREIEFVRVEEASWGGEVLLHRPWTTPAYTSDDYQNRGPLGIACAVVLTSFASERNFSRHLFATKSRIIFLVDAGKDGSLDGSSVADFIQSNGKKCSYNSIVVIFNSSSFEGYFLDPVRQRLTPVPVPARSIYPTIGELGDLRGYELHTAFVPGESDLSVLVTILRTLASARNGTLQGPVGLRALDLLEFSRKRRWQFTLLTVGPTEHATCFFVPPAGLVPIGYILVEPFDTGTWCGVLLVAAVVVWLLTRFGQESRRGSLASSLITLLQSVLTSPNRISRSAFERRILTTCSLGGLVLVSAYQSTIFSLISNPARYPELDTEQQINRSCSLYVIGLDELGGIDTFRDSFLERANFRHGSSCLCTSCQVEQVLRREPRLARVYRVSRHRTHPFPILLSVADLHWPPLDALVEWYVSGFFEAGITVKLIEGRRKTGGDAGWDHRGGVPSQQLRVSDLHIVWMVLVIGLAFAVACFVAELAVKHRRRIMERGGRIRALCRRKPKLLAITKATIPQITK